VVPFVHTPKADDGVLIGSEAAQLKLDADLVTLSACNTAAPDGTPGAEGLSGLAPAFVYAGTRSHIFALGADAAGVGQVLPALHLEHRPVRNSITLASLLCSRVRVSTCVIPMLRLLLFEQMRGKLIMKFSQNGS
jgi:CHAT domain